MRKVIGLITLLPFIPLLSACDMGPPSGFGFSLPQGDVEAGEQAFVEFNCTDCHSVVGREDLRESIKPEMTVSLGGEAPRIQTYGQLVTSIINPSHKISQKYSAEAVAENGTSKMRNYNDVLTVAELIDLVAFLQAQYELKKYEVTHYPAMYH